MYYREYYSPEEIEKMREAEEIRLAMAAKDYPGDCLVCGGRLSDTHHPDDPPVHSCCEDDYFDGAMPGEEERFC